MNVEMVRLFRKKIENGIVSGPFSKTCDPAFIEVMGYSGCDFVIIDLEHGPNHIENIQNLIRAAEISGVFPIVRIKENMLNMAGEALDVDALGIQVPQIENRQRLLSNMQSFPHWAKEGFAGMSGQQNILIWINLIILTVQMRLSLSFSLKEKKCLTI